MTSLNRQKGTYTYGEDSTDAFTTDHETARRRQATVFDAVAGRVSLKFAKGSALSGSRKTSSGHHQLADPVLAPEEVLFARKNAPQRYAEKDTYLAHEDLVDNGRDILPESDMLKAVHAYTGHFYEAMAQRHERKGRGHIRRVEERSMDETALLAFGILLEEAARDSLGKSGDLVFTEGVESTHEQHEEDTNEEENAQGQQQQEIRAQRRSQRCSNTPINFEGEEEFWKRKYSKRRKVQDEGG